MFNLISTILIFTLMGTVGLMIRHKHSKVMAWHTIKLNNLTEWVLYLAFIAWILTKIVY